MYPTSITSVLITGEADKCTVQIFRKKGSAITMLCDQINAGRLVAALVADGFIEDPEIQGRYIRKP